MDEKFCDIFYFACMFVEEHDTRLIFFSKDASFNSLSYLRDQIFIKVLKILIGH
jgi:hypothetical protein